MNSLEHPWLPVCRLDGSRQVASVRDLVASHGANPIVALDFPRPDLNAAVMQWLIGLLQTACPPKSQDHWMEWFVTPPTPEQLHAALKPLVPYFELGGDGMRYFQDLDPLEDAKPVGIDGLLMDAPGGNTLNLNKDLFVKRDQVRAICPSCVAAALTHLQMSAPSGGAGHNTSLRGGGPLTTLVVSSPLDGQPATLWRDCWLNVLPRSDLFRHGSAGSDADIAEAFPWCRPTLTSEDANRAARRQAIKQGGEALGKARKEIPSSVGHPLWVYWATPRRIRLDFDAVVAGACDLCGQEGEGRVTQYRTRPYGANYTTGWRHPLSPYYKLKPTDPDFLPQHPHGALHYRHWLDLNGQTGETRVAAMVVTRFAERRALLLDEGEGTDAMPFRLRAFGAEMDNMKMLRWHEGYMPLARINSRVLEDQVACLISAAGYAESALRRAIRDAWLARQSKVKADAAPIIGETFWQRTEPAFYRVLDQLTDLLSAAETDEPRLVSVKEGWLLALRRAAENLFDEVVGCSDIALGNPRRVAEARQSLHQILNAERLRKDLGLPIARGASSARKSRKSA